jgi:hypothetical protein
MSTREQDGGTVGFFTLFQYGAWVLLQQDLKPPSPPGRELKK